MISVYFSKDRLYSYRLLLTLKSINPFPFLQRVNNILLFTAKISYYSFPGVAGCNLNKNYTFVKRLISSMQTKYNTKI